MNQDDLVKQLMAIFLDELEEHVQSMNRDLLTLERDLGQDNRELLHRLFRTAHSLKGAARSVDIDLLATACHRLEEILDRVRNREMSLTPALFALMFESVDAIQEAGKRLRAGRDLADAPLVQIVARLDVEPEHWARVTEESSGPAAAPDSVPGPAEPAPDAGASAQARPVSSPEPGTQAAATVAPELPPAADAPLPGHTGSRPAAEAGAGADSDEGPTAAPAASPPGGAAGDEAEAPRGGAAAGKGAEASNKTAEAATVRVPAEKLDTLLTRSGELMQATRAAEDLSDTIDTVRRTIRELQREWMRLDRMVYRKEREQRALYESKSGKAATTFLEELSRIISGSSTTLNRIGRRIENVMLASMQNSRTLGQAVRGVDDEVHRLRLLPFAVACSGLDRTVRDLATELGKNVRFVITGAQVEIDRSVLEGLRSPLLHLVRNAVDHGVEPPDQRAARGKPPVAEIRVECVLRGAQVEVSVSDDGRGIDLEAIRRHARRRGIPEPADERALTQLIFRPGFTTSSIITEISGRGVGLDVVKEHVQLLHGTVRLATSWGRGASFVMTVPLTLTTIRVVLVRVAGQLYAVPATTVRALVRPLLRDVQLVEGRQTILFDGNRIPLVPLVAALGGASAPAPGPSAEIDHLSALVVVSDGYTVALEVDEMVAEQDIVVKHLGRRLRRVPHVAGATLLATGEIGMVLNTAEVVQSAMRTRVRGPVQETDTRDRRLRVLVADDTMTTRMLEKSILEAAGYEVTVAADGVQAWELLQAQGADLVLTDAEMPRMDGFEFTKAIRQSPRFRDIPVVLLTGLRSERDKARGVEAGADAYLVKGVFDQNQLLEVIKQLI